MENGQIKDRIRKLLAMAAENSGASKDEAQTAMKMAMALMAKHGIEQDQIPVQEANKARFGERVRTQPSNKRDLAAMQPHQVSLACAAGTLYGCRSLFYNRGKYGFVFVGRVDNIDAAEATLFWLIRQVDELYKKAVIGTPAFQIGEFRKNFKRECSSRVWQRAIALMNDHQMIAQETGKNALVVKDYFEKLAAENTALIEGKVKTTQMRAGRVRYGAGSTAGYAAGEKVKLRKEVEAHA